MSDMREVAKKTYQKGEPYSKLKNWFNEVTSSSNSEESSKPDTPPDTPREAAKQVRKNKKNWDFSDASLKNL